MANWKLTDDYGTRYPALTNSVLSALVFSDHTIAGAAFTGTIDIAATGDALETVGALLEVQYIQVTGTITDISGTLTVNLHSVDPDSSFSKGLTKAIPLIGQLFSAVQMTFQTTLTDANDADAEWADVYQLSADLTIGSHQAKLTSTIPMHGDFMTIDANPELAITLGDLEHLLSGNNKWPDNFPSNYSQQPALSLLQVGVEIYIELSPFSVTLVAITVVVGITGLPIIPDKLYLNPLGVWIMVTTPVESPQVTYGIEGKLALTNYATPTDFNNADFVLDFAMSLDNFTIAASLENTNANNDDPDNDDEVDTPPPPLSPHSVNTLIKDMFGSGVSIGLPDALTIDDFDFGGSTANGNVQDFYFDLAMSGGFGLFKDFDINEFRMSLKYTAG